MANAAVDTGHGATLTLSSTAQSFNWTGIQIGQSSIADIETTWLGSGAKKTYVPGDVSEEGEVTIPFQFDSEAAMPTKGTVQTLTITWPTLTGQTTPANLAGTGYIKSVTPPNFQTDQLQTGEIVFKWNGLTGPTYTPAT